MSEEPQLSGGEQQEFRGWVQDVLDARRIQAGTKALAMKYCTGLAETWHQIGLDDLLPAPLLAMKQ